MFWHLALVKCISGFYRRLEVQKEGFFYNKYYTFEPKYLSND